MVIWVCLVKVYVCVHLQNYAWLLFYNKTTLIPWQHKLSHDIANILFEVTLDPRPSQSPVWKSRGRKGLAVGTRESNMRWAKNWSGEASLWTMHAQSSVWSDISLSSVNGTTGESLSLTVEERKLLTEEWIQTAIGRWVGFIWDWSQRKQVKKLYLRNFASIMYSIVRLKGKRAYLHWLLVLLSLCFHGNRITVIVHVGCENLKNTCELVRLQ